MTDIRDARRDTKARGNKGAERLSPDGKWRSFSKVPNLLQYVSTGLYFARTRINGKLIRRSLKAETFEEAKLALQDVARHPELEPERGTVGEGLKAYLRQVNTAHDLSPQTKRCRRYCLKALLANWPGLRKLKADRVRAADCQEWAGRFSAAKDEQCFNHTLAVLRTLLELGGIPHDQNPAPRANGWA